MQVDERNSVDPCGSLVKAAGRCRILGSTWMYLGVYGNWELIEISTERTLGI